VARSADRGEAGVARLGHYSDPFGFGGPFARWWLAPSVSNNYEAVRAVQLSAPVTTTETPATVRPTLLLGMALTAATALMLELLLTRVFDVAWVRNMAYMVITCAVFAYGLAGLYVTVRPLPEGQGVDRAAAKLTLLVALASVLLLPAINLIPFKGFGS